MEILFLRDLHVEQGWKRGRQVGMIILCKNKSSLEQYQARPKKRQNPREKSLCDHSWGGSTKDVLLDMVLVDVL